MNLDHIWMEVRNNETSAFELLYRLLYPGMCYYASQMLMDRCTAEEVVQDIFLKVWEKRQNIYSRENSLKKYLYRLTHNQCIDILKQHNTRKKSFIKLLPSDTWASISEQYGFDEQMVEQLDANDTAVKIQRAIDRLPAQCREVFVKSRFEDLSDKEIAVTMNISENTVRTQIYRALQKIKQIICIFLNIL
jgi:RNA polymerase sigma-70 factor (ECF subfamily)